MTSMTAQRVARGVALLDAYNRHWREEVDLSTLSMISTDKCVLGQVFRNAGGYSGYSSGMRAFFGETWAEADSIENGFAADATGDYPALDAEWKRVIRDFQQDDNEPLASWERELLNGDSEQVIRDNLRSEGVAQGRAEGVTSYQNRLTDVSSALRVALPDLHFTVEDVMGLTNVLIDNGTIAL